MSLPPSHPPAPLEAKGLAALLQSLREIELGGGVSAASPRGSGAAVATDWPSLDGRMSSLSGAPGLVRGALHEWIGTCSAERRPPVRGPWTPPLGLLGYLATRALKERLAGPENRCGWALWIGRAVHPYPVPLVQTSCVRETPSDVQPNSNDCRLSLDVVLDETSGENNSEDQSLLNLLLKRVLFVDPRDLGTKLWATDTSLRCSSVTAVVLDGTGLDMSATRRLQLAARNSAALVLVARPPWEEHVLSAATTRWRVRRNFVTGATSPAAPSSLTSPSWRLELARCKGTQSLQG